MTHWFSQLRKEFRLLLPAWVAAACSVCLPIGRWDAGWQILVVATGMTLLAVRGFGSEFQQGTFTLYIGQPARRFRLWLLKAAPLTLAMAAVLLLWHALALFLASRVERVPLPLVMSMEPGQLPWLWTAAIVATGSGLFFSLLFRQTAAALWATLLTPVGLGLVLATAVSWWMPESADEILQIILNPLALCYGIAMGLGSWLLFRRGQDLDRLNVVVGRTLSLPKSLTNVSRDRRPPRWSLLSKELGLQQINIVVMLFLVVLHFIVVALGKWVISPQNAYITVSTMMTWLLLVMLPPLLIGCAAVAEERRLGVTLWHRTLPISNGLQWLTKLVVVYGLTLVASYILPHVLRMELRDLASKEQFLIMLVSFGLATLGFYLSSLSRSLLATLGISILLGVGIAVGVKEGMDWIRRGVLMEGHIESWLFGFIRLALVVTAAALLPAMLALVYRNMKQVLVTGRDLKVNLLALFAVVFVSVGVTAGVFWRAWELVVPFPEPEPTTRLHGTLRPKVEGWLDLQFALLPDGRLINVHASQALPAPTVVPVTTPDGGSTWKDVSFSGVSRKVFGIRSDGTLWSWGKHHFITNVRPVTPAAIEANQPPQQEDAATDWARVASSSSHTLALKEDGSLWAWGSNNHGQLGTGSLQPETAPVRIGTDTDWVQISAWWASSIALKRDGSIWRWGIDRSVVPNRPLPDPAPVDNGTGWMDVEGTGLAILGIRNDGTLWLINPDRLHFEGEPPQKAWQIGRDTDWKALGSATVQTMALKQDGTLWAIPLPWMMGGERTLDPKLLEPERVSASTNWIAASDFAALAADGSFIGWPFGKYWLPPSDTLFSLAPSRLSPFAINVAQGKKP